MNLKINLKARLKRYYQNQIHNNKKNTLNIVKKFKIVATLLVLIFPIYPSFWSFSYDQPQWPNPDYDPNTILSSYEDFPQWDIWLSWEPGFIRPWEVSLWDRDLTWVNKLVIYKVQPGDSFDIIADKFEIDSKSIIWANNFGEDKTLQPWEEIKIPPVSWFVYTVESEDTLDSVAEYFNIDKNKIIEQNKLDPNADLKIWQVLIIPGWKKVFQAVEQVEEKQENITTKNSTGKNSVPKKDPKKQTKKNTTIAKSDNWKSPTKSWYAVAWRGKPNRFAPWYCTRFVANYKNVTWRGNAWEWLHNAAAAWVSTWRTAAAGSIVVFKWRWYSAYYGHVWIVVWVEWDSIIVKDMNYAGRYVVTIRKVSKNDSAIRGYIYVN